MSEKANWTPRLAFAALAFGLLALLTACGLLALVLVRNAGSGLALLLGVDLLLGLAAAGLLVLLLRRAL